MHLTVEHLITQLSSFYSKNMSAHVESPKDTCIPFGSHIEAKIAVHYRGGIYLGVNSTRTNTI